jgi:cytochrome c6
MNLANSVRKRLAIMGAVLALTIASAIPLIGMAQGDGSSPRMTETELLQEGERIYENVCIACHQADGNGIAGIYLPLNNNPLITLDDPEYLITTVLNGRGGMPRFDNTYDDEEIAAIVSYIRQAWDNDAPPVSAEEVADVRAQFLMTTPTPEGQIPAGQYAGTPDAGTPIVAPEAEATPEATP